MISLLNEREFKINDNLTLLIPTVGQYRGKDKNMSEQERKKFQESYFGIMNLFMKTPSDYMVELDDDGINFTTIDEYTFFLQLFNATFVFAKENGLPCPDSKVVFKDLDFAKLKIMVDNTTEEMYIADENDNMIINKRLYMQISSCFSTIFFREKTRRRPADNTSRKYIIETEREHREYLRKTKDKDDNFDDVIVALVCDSGFPYDFQSVNEKLTIYDLYCCLRQIMKRKDVDYIMNGAYSGFGIDISKINPKQLDWLSFK